ncbi:hypothetical protein MRX96_012865 [Rhipicephalus microplus]
MRIDSEGSGIEHFPQAYSYLDTPYPETDFPPGHTRCVSQAELRWCRGPCSQSGGGRRCLRGKTCLITKFCHEVYDANYKATIGVGLRSGEVQHPPRCHSACKLVGGLSKMEGGEADCWDTAGQERFRSITSAYYRGAQVVILVFDLSLAASLYNTPQWLEETLESTGQGHEPLRFLVGTKKDLVNDGCLDGMEGDATKIARRLDAEYWSVSAKTGENVQQLFFRVAALAFVQCLTRELQEKQQSPEKAANNNFVRLRKRKHGKKIKAPKCSGSQKCATK